MSARPWLARYDAGVPSSLAPYPPDTAVDSIRRCAADSGYQVWPREVEEALSAHSAVLEVGVTGVPHQLRGEVPKAWVVLRPGAQASPSELRSYCRDRLAPYKVPAEVAIVAELPKSPVGKVLRRKLRELDSLPSLPTAAGEPRHVGSSDRM